ncbi:unnamed protein product [Cylicostephanus goldi]|uniref:Uncharacterized protein n=1 Tax=Cylicostephanus goldi TaxID=71465 RepID=A0A3P7NJ41_CYLGO|nr:unnamed protein product [Cylicostephanus goldi]
MDHPAIKERRDCLESTENVEEMDRWDNLVHKVLLVTVIQDSLVLVVLKEKWEMLVILVHQVPRVLLVQPLLSNSSKEKMERLVLTEHLVCPENEVQMAYQVYLDRSVMIGINQTFSHFFL